MIDLNTLYPELESMIDSKLKDLSTAQKNELGPLCDELNIFYRTCGIAAILIDLDSDKFYHMLIRSGYTRLFLLEQFSGEHKMESRFCKITRSNGLFDSIAANRIDIAKEIADLSPMKWNKKFEYEDDYCFILFIHEMIKNPENNILEFILQRFKGILANQSSSKYDVCFSLLERDDSSFDQSFMAMLNDWENELDRQAKSIGRNEVEFSTAKYVYIQGLALLKMAEKLGIKTKDEYLFCPKEARMKLVKPFPENGYPKY